MPSDLEMMIRNIIEKHPSSDVTATVLLGGDVSVGNKYFMYKT